MRTANNISRHGKVVVMPAKPLIPDILNPALSGSFPFFDLAPEVESEQSSARRWTCHFSYVRDDRNNADFDTVALVNAGLDGTAPVKAIVRFGDGAGSPHVLEVPVPRFGITVSVAGMWARGLAEYNRNTLSELRVVGSIARGNPVRTTVGFPLSGTAGLNTIVIPDFCAGRLVAETVTSTATNQLDFAGNTIFTNQQRDMIAIHPLCAALGQPAGAARAFNLDIVS